MRIDYITPYVGVHHFHLRDSHPLTRAVLLLTNFTSIHTYYFNAHVLQDSR
nr:MAG TPA: hypothetical protein [Caudoviricetes sp.]